MKRRLATSIGALRNVKHMVVVGGGVGGLTFVNSLVKRARDCNAIESLPRITVFCRRSLMRGLGLWPNSVRVLHKVGLENVLKSSGLKIPSAAYRSASGQWLSKCSATQENHERVVSLLEKDLLTALHQNVEGVEQIKFIDGNVVDICTKSKYNDDKGSNFFEINYEDTERNEGGGMNWIESDFVIGADGTNSITRRSSIFETEATKNGISSKLVNTDEIVLSSILGTKSATVDGSITPKLPANILKRCDYPFETLGSHDGSRIRFACVPLVENSIFFFATIPTKLLDLSKPFPEQLRTISAELHQPIPDILSFVIENSLNVHSEPIYRFDDGSNQHSTTFNFNKILDRFYLIGDAWHAELHNLAQGAAVSIEDAWELAHALTSESTLSDAQVKFLDNRRVRIAKYKKFTFFTNCISDFDSYGNAGSAIRNSMRFVPPFINGKIFDYALAESLGGKFYRLSE